MKSRVFNRITRTLSPGFSVAAHLLARAVRLSFLFISLLFRVIRYVIIGGLQFINSVSDEIRAIRLADWWDEYLNRQIAKMALCLWTVLSGISWVVLPYGLGWRPEIDCPRRECKFLVDINAADWPELSLLPRIGPILSQRIIADRDNHGPFRRPEDLLRVRGIGPGILRGIQPYLKFSDQHEENGIP